MSKKNLSVLAIIFTFIFSSCHNNSSDDEISESDIDGSVLSQNEITYSVTYDNITNDMTMDSEHNVTLESTDEFRLLNDKGIMALVEDDIIWNNFLHDNYSFSENYVPKQIEYNNETYIEMALADTSDMESIFKSLYIEYDKNCEDFIVCPFTSLEDMKCHMQNVYTNNKIDEIINHSTIIEYDNSLYDTDSGKVYEARIPKSISITNQTDNRIVFSIYYESPYNDIAFTVDYNVTLTDSGWRIDTNL